MGDPRVEPKIESKRWGQVDGKVTLADIALRVGTSVATISNAYNRPEKLSRNLRIRIFEIAHELGYAGPNPLASGLRRGHAGAVGWVVPESLSYAVTDPATLPFFRGMVEEFHEARVGFLIIPSSSEAAPDVSVVSRAIVDGFIITFANDDPFLEAVLARNLPTVVVEQPKLPGVPTVLVNSRLGARRVAEHLLGLGHRRFGVLLLRTGHDGFLGEVTAQRRKKIAYETTKERLSGYLSALAKAGIGIGDIPMYEPVSSREGGKEGAAWLLSRSPRPTAILAMSDLLALGAMDVARRKGIRVPDELSVVGFDDIDEAPLAHPPLTTVHQPLQDKGRIAAKLLLYPEQFTTTVVTLPTKLVLRGSTREPPVP